MLGKNIKYYRLKKNMSIRELASEINVSPMTVSNYERDARKPGMDMIKALAKALDIRVSDFLEDHGNSLQFVHGEFRKNVRLTKTKQEYIREAVEEYFSRFFEVVEILGRKTLGASPKTHALTLQDDVEANAKKLREYLHLPASGPVGNLIEVLENQGILVMFLNIDDDDFSGMNGTVNGRPYIVINSNMSAERIRSTLVHETSHFAFAWPESIQEQENEKMATAISGAFLFPEDDAFRELGGRRTAVTNDMISVCQEYGISMFLLVKRANICRIISDTAAKDFYIRASRAGWRKAEPERTAKERPGLFSQLVYRAVCENDITVQKGAELLKQPYETVQKQCAAIGG